MSIGKVVTIPQPYADTIYEICQHIIKLEKVHSDWNCSKSDIDELSKNLNMLLNYNLPESLMQTLENAIGDVKLIDLPIQLYHLEIIETVINHPIIIIYRSIYTVVKETFSHSSGDMIIDLEKLCKDVEKNPMYVEYVHHIQTQTSRHCRKFCKWLLNTITQKRYIPDVEF